MHWGITGPQCSVGLAAKAEKVNALKCKPLSNCLLVILMLSYADFSWSQTATAPVDRAGKETHSLVHAPTKLPFHLYWDYLVIVEGSIGNIQKLNFLVDTGAYPNVVDQKIAHKLGLAEQPARVTLSTQSVQTRIVILPSLVLGPIRAESLSVLTQDLSYFQHSLGHKVDAIVG